MKLPVERVPCKCGELEGVLILRRALIEVEDVNGNVKRMAPTEFEAMAGRGSAKKWKESVKVGQDIPQFQGKPVGAYMRDQLGVDINRGTLQAYNPDKKPGANSKATPAQNKTTPLSPKPAKTPPTRPPKSPPARKRHSPMLSEPSFEPSPSPPPDHDTQSQPEQLSTKLPLLDRINMHSERQFCCYEPPCEAYERERDNNTDTNASILMKSPAAGSQPAASRVDVPIHEGRPRSTKGILCLETVSMASLIDLGLMSATKEADLRKILLSEIPSVPADRLSNIPLYDNSAKKKAKVK